MGILEKERDKNKETGLKERGGIEISIYSAFPYMHANFRIEKERDKKQGDRFEGERRNRNL